MQISVTNSSQLDGVTASSGGCSRSNNSGSSAADGSGASGTSSVSVSQGGQLLSQLQQLEQTDPAKFKQVLSDIADKLKAAAQQDGGQSRQDGFLTKLADRFDQASQTGDLSVLQPHHHHHHGGGAAAAYAQNNGSDAAGSAATAVAAPAGGAGGVFSQVKSIIDQVMSSDLSAMAATAA